MLPAQRDEIIFVKPSVEVIRQRRDVMDRQPSGLDAPSRGAHATAMIVSPHDCSGFLAPHLCISEPIRPRISLLDLWSHASTFVNTTTNCAISLNHVSPVSDVTDAVTDHLRTAETALRNTSQRFTPCHRCRSPLYIFFYYC